MPFSIMRLLRRVPYTRVRLCVALLRYAVPPPPVDILLLCGEGGGYPVCDSPQTSLALRGPIRSARLPSGVPASYLSPSPITERDASGCSAVFEECFLSHCSAALLRYCCGSRRVWVRARALPCVCLYPSLLLCLRGGGAVARLCHVHAAPLVCLMSMRWLFS